LPSSRRPRSPAACTGTSRSSAPESPEQRYKLQTIERGEITQTVSANGTLNPVVLVNVGTQVSGTVTRLYVDFNDKVEKGQALLELDDSLLAAQARQSAANVVNVSAALDLARANEARMQALFAEEYVSRQELEQAIQARRSSRGAAGAGQGRGRQGQVNLHYTTIRSPVSGVVVDRVVDLGQTVAASLQTPTLIKIAQDLSEMRIDSSFAEADIGKIREGQKVRFTVDAFPGPQFPGRGAADSPQPDDAAERRHLQRARFAFQSRTDPAARHDRLRQHRRRQPRRRPAGAERRAAFQAGRRGEKTAGRAQPAARSRRRAGRGKGSRPRDTASGTVYVVEQGTLKPVSVQLGITDNRNSEVSAAT
jgi:HlyD family secretion protein